MRISIPEKSVYYYDQSQKDDPVLLCWFPRQILENKVKNESVSKKILMDYPDGLDMEVHDEEFVRFQEKYGLKMPYDAVEILVNFEAFQRSRKVKTWGSIDAEALETSEITDAPLAKVKFPKGSLLGAVVRNGEVIIPRGDTVIMPKDRLIIFTLRKVVPQLEKLLTVKLEYF